MNAPRRLIARKKSAQRPDGFTLVELLVVIATVAVLAAMLLPALAGTKPNSQSFQCMENQRQVILAWQMYAEDNTDLLPPNDYPFQTSYFIASSALTVPATRLANWVVGTMEQATDATTTAGQKELLDRSSLLSTYITNAAAYHCPADNSIDPNSHTIHARSYSMNSAVGTIWSTSTTYAAANGTGSSGLLGTAVQGGWLNGASYNAAQKTWLTYGKISSFSKPGPANTFVTMDENPLSINDGALDVSAVATPGNTYVIDFPAGNHNGAAGISFADGHVIIHKWLDARTYTPAGLTGPGQGATGSIHESPDDQDCFYLAPITSAAR